MLKGCRFNFHPTPMQISPTQLASTAPFANSSSGPEKNGKPLTGPIDLTAPAQTTDAASAIAEEAVSVSISTASPPPEPAYTPAPVYAEIWKGSQKVAQIDFHGDVVSLTGQPASTGSAGSLAGPIVAAQRTAQLAQQLGGEIRVAGLSIDSQTLVMRAKIANTYL
jgi:hypothetical protein